MSKIIRAEAGDLPENTTNPSAAMHSEDASQWPDPDPVFLRRGRRHPPPLPGKEIFGDWHPWISEAADGAGAPPDYVALPLLTAIAVLIGNGRVVSPWPSWQEPAILWVGIVGDPSSGKSPGADPVLSAVRAVEQEIGETFDERHRQWQTQAASAAAEKEDWERSVREAVKAGIDPPIIPTTAIAPPEPQRPRIVTSDVTPERLGALLAENPNGLLNTRDELSGWLQGFDRYSKGGERSFWLEAFGGRSFTIDRVKAGGSVQIPRLSISVFGGIQPDRLTSLILSGDDDGLPARFMWAWPDPLPPKRPNGNASPSFIRTAFSRLASLRCGRDESGDVPIPLMLAAGASDVFQEWRKEHAKKARATAGMVESAWGKMPGVLLRLAMILEFAAWSISPAGTPEPQEVSESMTKRAIGFIEGYLKPMADRVYADAAVSEDERLAMSLARWIAHNRPNRINTRELMRRAAIPGLKGKQATDKAINQLVEAGWLRPEASATAGRPRRDYLVNPRIADLLET